MISGEWLSDESQSTIMVTILTLDLQDLLDLIVQDEHEGTTSASEDIGEGTLEEGAGALSLGNGRPAVDGVLVQDIGLGTSRLHHHAPTDGIEGVGDDSSNGGDGLSDGPADDERGVLGIRQHAAGGIVEAEVCGAVDNDTLHRHSKASVETDDSIRLGDLAQAVSEAFELALAVAFADVGGEASTRKVERVHEAQGGGSSGSAGSEVTREVAPELRVLVYSSEEQLLVLVLESEVQRLRGEVPDDIGKVSTPEGAEALLLGNADEGIDDTLVALVHGDLLADVLHLEQQLDTLDGRDGRLGDGGGDTASQEVFRERDRIGEVRHFVRLGGLAARNLKDHTRNGIITKHEPLIFYQEICE